MKIPSVKGFHDILPDESARWAWVETQARAVCSRYNVTEIRVPIVERTELFNRSIGETTDIVEKEMYTFADRDGSSLTLRPEGTASIVRAYVENALHQREPVSKLFYMGPMFRRERPQKGRLRQFAQIGVEVIGRDDAAIDAEVVLLLDDMLRAFAVRGARIELNSLGCAVCRPGYRAALAAFGGTRRADLCENCRRRLERNPLRLLDCKDPACRTATADAPLMLDRLCAACGAHFDTVRNVIEREGIAAGLNPRMVRGLDYYVRTAFEVIAEGLGAQNAVGGGGRYDGLVKALGGPDTPGIGFALGVERLLLSLAADAAPHPQAPEVFVVPLGAAAEREAIHLAHRWRRDGARVDLASGTKSLRSQMRLADKSGARYALLLGEDELAARALTVRDMVAKRDFPCAVGFEVSAAALREALARCAAAPTTTTLEQHA
ncbi:histidine--tRNA ligase [Candidatus Binatia bacterium]|nr:histidine--tRNA ligase [Candidatus Binatia bacterium]